MKPRAVSCLSHLQIYDGSPESVIRRILKINPKSHTLPMDFSSKMYYIDIIREKA